MRLLRLVSALASVSLAFAWKKFTVDCSQGGNDTPALAAAFKNHPEYATDTTIEFEKNCSYNFLTPVNFPRFKNVILSIQGNISYAADVTATQEAVLNPANSGYNRAWFAFDGGNNVTLEGSQDPYFGWVDSHGQSWWDVMQKAEDQVGRPVGWNFLGITKGEIKYMKVRQSVAWSFIVTGEDIHIHDNMLISQSNNAKIHRYNTDGFNIGANNTVVENNVIYNEDDCIVFCSPSVNAHIRGNRCVGSNGLSITGTALKAGTTADIRNVLFENSTIENALYGARFGSWLGTGGTAQNITWKDITMTNVKYPIYVTQNFPYSSSGNKRTNIKDFTYQNIHGTLNDTYNNPNVITFELYSGTVTGIHTKGLNVKALSGKATTVKCDPNAVRDPATGAAPDMGFVCTNGLFTQTAIGK